MTRADLTPEERFARLVDSFDEAPDVTHATDVDGRRRRGFGSGSLMAGGKIFAMLVGDRLVVKIPKSRVDELVQDGEGERFDPRKNGRVMKEWLVLAADSDIAWDELAEEARRFVAGA